jgi:hypothetical protein
MWLHAVLLCPFRVPAGSGIIVTDLGSDDTHIAFSKADETRVTVALGKTLAGFPAAGDAIDFTLVVKPDPAADMRIKINQRIIYRQLILHRRGQMRFHFQNIADHF